MRARWFVAVAVVLASTSSRAGDDDVVDSWYAHFHKDVKAGWDHVRRVHTKQDGKPVWVTETESLVIRLQAGPRLKTPMTSSSRVVEDDAGEVISYATSVDPGTGAQRHEGTVAGGVVSAVDDGKARTMPYPAGALGPAAVDRAIFASLKPTASGEVVAFRPSGPASSGPTTWKVAQQTELVDVLGRFAWMYRVEKRGPDGLLDVVYYGADGREFVGATDMGAHRWLLTEEPVAKTDADPASLLTSRIVAPDRAIDVASKPARVVLRLAKKNGKVGNLEDAVGQRVVARKDGAVEIEIVSAEPPATTKVEARPYAGKEDMKRYLAATPIAETGNARLKEYADAAVSELINSLRCARAIEWFVKENVQPAPANVGFGTACDVISSGTGDSTETAVLAAALARASGVPSRLVGGFVYWAADQWPDDRYHDGAFAPHFWAEIYVGDGVWKPVDPMRMDGTKPVGTIDSLAGHGGFDATHVAVLRSDLATDKPVTDIVLPVLAFMDGLTIEVVEPKAAGK
jgi:hypothetical protein